MTAPEQPVTDVHTHAMPLELLRELADDGMADLSGLPAGWVHIDRRVSGVPPHSAIPCPPEQYDATARVRSMDAAEVDVHLVSAPPFLSGHQLPPEETGRLVRRVNDALAGFVAARPDRLRALGLIVPGLPDAVAEAARCVTELGFAGVSIGSRGFAGELDHADHEPLWQHLAATGTFALLHPARTPAPERMADFHLIQLLGFPLETTLAASRLVFGGVLDRHDLQLCLAHGGGCLLAAAPRLDLGWRRKTVAHTTARLPSAYLSRFYYDTAVFDARLLRRLVDDVGVERVLLGTDAPFDLADRQPRDTVAALGLSAGDEHRILAGTVAGLLAGVTTAVAGPGGA